MKEISRFVRKLRGLNSVIRWSFHPHLRHENVAEHSYWVAVFTMILADPSVRSELVMVALLHDAEESITSDCPALVKRNVPCWPSVVALADAELVGSGTGEFFDLLKRLRAQAETSAVVKLGDLFAALMYAHDEITFGNTNFKRIECELIQSIVNAAQKAEDKDLGTRARYLLDKLGFEEHWGVPRPTEMSHL